MRNELSKEDLYNSVKSLIECEAKHKLLNQHKLFTLYSIAFQYLLYSSTKVSGAYIIRIDTPQLAEKLAKKAKDSSSRKFLQSLLLPRRLKYGKSTFYLDFFHLGSWNMTNEIPAEKIMGALVIKNTSSHVMEANFDTNEEEQEDQIPTLKDELGEHYYIKSLQMIAKDTVTIAYNEEIDDLQTLNFPFIKEKEEASLSGVTLTDKI